MPRRTCGAPHGTVDLSGSPVPLDNEIPYLDRSILLLAERVGGQPQGEDGSDHRDVSDVASLAGVHPGAGASLGEWGTVMTVAHRVRCSGMGA